jgi:hypothetical protein
MQCASMGTQIAYLLDQREVITAAIAVLWLASNR